MTFKDKINSFFPRTERVDTVDETLETDDTQGQPESGDDAHLAGGGLGVLGAQPPKMNPLARLLARLHTEPQVTGARDPLAFEEKVLAALGPAPTPLPVLGRLSPRQQHALVGSSIAAFLIGGVIVGLAGTRAANFDLQRVSIATRVQMLSQRLASAAEMSLQGDLLSINKMRTAQSEMAQAMNLLTIGNSATGMDGLSREKLDSLLSLDHNTRALDGRISNLINLSTGLTQIELNAVKLEQYSGTLFTDANQLHSLLYSSRNATAQQLAAADHLRLLSERVHRNGIVLLRSPNASNDALAQLVADVRNYRDVLSQLTSGDEALLTLPVASTDGQALLASLSRSLDGLSQFAAYMEKHSANIVAARQGQKSLAGLSDAILRDATRLTEQLAEAASADRTVQLAAMLMLMGAMVSMLIVALVNTRLTKIDAWFEAARSKTAQLDAEKADLTNRKNENDIIEFMTDIFPLETGDLTVDYTKNMSAMEGITGSVRSSVNEGIIALRAAVDTVKATAARVSALVGSSVESTLALDASNQHQASEIDDVVSAVGDLTASIAQVTERTLLAARIAAEARAAAAEGGSVVEHSDLNMAKIRTGMQEVSKSVKHSGETSQEISAIVGMIEVITDKTQIIAVNASMEAARAGAAGAPFKVLAAEVNRLAEQSKELQLTIAALVQRNQGETAATIKLVEESANAVVEGARLSSLANAELTKISEITRTIAELMTEIETASHSQSGNAGTVSAKMAALSALSRQFQSSVNTVVTSVGEIDQSMSGLKTTVDQFRTTVE